MEEFKFNAQSRQEHGKRAVSRIRKAGFVPVNIYGHKQENRHVYLDFKRFEKFIDEGHRMLSIEVDGITEHGVIKELQYDSLGTKVIHADVARVDLEEKIVMTVPIVTVGVAKGQAGGGILEVILKEIPVEGPANSIPEKIEIPIVNLEVHQSIRVKDLEPPPRCQFEHDPEDLILAIHERKHAVEEGEAPAAEPEMPEVISRKPEEEETEEKTK